MLWKAWFAFIKLLLRIRFLRYVRPEVRAPWGYGVCWQDWFKNEALVCPIPFNVVVGLLRWVYMAFRGGVPEHWNEIAGRRQAGYEGLIHERADILLLRAIEGEMTTLLERNEDEVGSPWADLQNWRDRIRAISRWGG